MCWIRISRVVACVLVSSLVCSATDEWTALFDGKSLKGWKAAENPTSFSVVDGVIVAQGPRAHLFFITAGAEFENFELELEARTEPGANSGVFFHTQWQDEGWPARGFEVQINNSQPQQGDYLELKKTGSLYGVHNIYRGVATDEAWFTLRVIVQKPLVRIWVNQVLVVEYIDAAPAEPTDINRLSQGTFALQCHDPASRAYFRNLRVRKLTAAAPAPLQNRDKNAARLITLGRSNFPVLELSTRVAGAMPVAEILDWSRRTGIATGLLTADAASAESLISQVRKSGAFVGFVVDSPVRAEQAADTLLRFDYVVGQLAEDPQDYRDADAWMENRVARIVHLVAECPIDVCAQVATLPPKLAARSEELWTDERVDRVVAAAAAHGVALEIDAVNKLPSPAFVARAKRAGVKFTVSAGLQPEAWSYLFELHEKLNLTWRDMYVPGHRPSRAQRTHEARRTAVR